ncbi:MAG: GNAT family N-acetyltransferase, partial [Candidatus Omnitrophica bacterium]|nr:GNAT family N-acetyltransferase [Candidatus Omnitrophota bacterium]
GGVLTIDQIAVDPVWQRRGIARAMILYAEGNCKDIRLMRVGTQVSNIPALRLYENLGFRIAEVSYVFHCHYS